MLGSMNKDDISNSSIDMNEVLNLIDATDNKFLNKRI